MKTRRDMLYLLLLIVPTVAAMMPHSTLEEIQVIPADDSYRLPKNVRPLTYDVYLKPEFQTFTYQGIVNIRVKVSEDTNDIVLHTNQQAISVIRVSGLEPVQDLLITEPDIDEERHFLTINSPIVQFQADTEYNIQIIFTATLAEDMFGFYRSSYFYDGETRWLASTQFQPTDARKAFPCFDEPAFKATFKIAIETPPTYHALSNMPVRNEKVLDDGWKLYEFEETGVMSTYLVAFIVSEFVSTDSIEKYHFTAWARSNAIEHAAYSQEVGPKLVDYFEEYTGIDYTFPKIDQVAVPDFSAGAMENWGLIKYRETALLYYDGVSTESNKKSIAMIITHELAHMWFGNLVTLEWWDYTWLNEGFARLFQYLAMDKIEPTWRLMEQFVVDQQHTIFANDALQNTQALTSPSFTPAQILAKFALISYNKGAAVLRMVSHVLGEGTFQRGLQRYLNEHKDGNTVPQDLFNTLEQQRAADGINVQLSVQEFFERWTTQPGYPVINVRRTDDIITVTQERFLLSGNAESELKWHVPLTWTTKSQAPQGFENTAFREWLLHTDTIKQLPDININSDEWIIFNNLETGYYRVNYDDDNWNLIIKELSENHNIIHRLNRAQLLDDALNLARAGKLEYPLALELTRYLEDEEDYIPWAAALNALSFLDRRLTNNEGYDDFKDYVQKLLANIHDTLGFEEKNDDTQDKLLHRVLVLTWACRLGGEDCVQRATHMFTEYRATAEINPIPANLRSIVYCTALGNGGVEEWDFLWERYRESIITQEQVTILSALGCTREESLLLRYLEMSIDADSGIRRQDAATAFAAVYNNPDGVQTAFNFLRSNFERISTFYGGLNALSNIITGIAGRLTTAQQVDNLRVFINENGPNLGAAAEAGRNAVEAATADLEWTNTHRDAILDWIRKVVFKPNSTTTYEPTTMTIVPDGPTTTTIGPTTTDEQTTTDRPTTTDEPTTTDSPTTTDEPSTTDGSGNVATNTIVITVAFIIALLHGTQIFNYKM